MVHIFNHRPDFLGLNDAAGPNAASHISTALASMCGEATSACWDSQVTTGLRPEQFVAPATAPTRIAAGIVCSGTVSMEKRDQAAVPTIAFESGEWCRAYDTLDNKCSTGRRDDHASAYAQTTCARYV